VRYLEEDRTMFSPDDIQTRLRDRPFILVRIVTTIGQTYDIYHPDLVLVARQFLIVGIPSPENPAQAEQITRIGMIHVSELRDLPRPVPPPNGAG
jgi:hypothetical protein